MVKLTAEIILKKTKLQRLEDVRNLNLFAYDITDASVLSDLPHVEVLSLSMNRISHLKDFTKCLRLRELYLRRNQVSSLTEVKHLTHLKELRVLWLSDNPCAALPGYEQRVCEVLPQLHMLDNMCTAGKFGDSQVQSDSSAISASLKSIEGREMDDMVEWSCVQQASIDHTAANIVASDVKHVASAVASFHHQDVGGHVGGKRADSVAASRTRDQPVLETAKDCNEGTAAQPGCGHSAPALVTPSPASSGFHVFKAVIHLLEELERGSDWNTLMAVNHDLQRRLERTVKQALREQHEQQQ